MNQRSQESVSIRAHRPTIDPRAISRVLRMWPCVSPSQKIQASASFSNPPPNNGGPMRYEEAKIDEAVLAVLYLTAWEEQGLTRAWKGIDWNASGRLHESGLIDDPKNKNKSINFTEKGLAFARACAAKLFSSDPP
jgi:hypothetical protein